MVDREKVVYHAANTGEEAGCSVPSARVTTTTLATPTRDATPEDGDDGDDAILTSVRVDDRQQEAVKPQRNGPIMLFDRASPTWWDPQFDSDILERKYGEMSFPESRAQFRSCLWYVSGAVVVWSLFYATIGGADRLYCAAAGSSCLVICILFLRATYQSSYQRLQTSLCATFALLLCLFLLIFLAILAPVSYLITVAAFTLSVELLLVLYSLVPLRLYVCAAMGVAFSAGFEALVVLAPRYSGIYSTLGAEQVVARALMHIALHLMGIHIYIMAQVRGRSTFLKVHIINVIKAC